MLHGHYTSAYALIGIVQNESLWATNIKFLNDEQEFIHAIELAKDVLLRSVKTSSLASSDLNRYKKFVSLVIDALDYLDDYDAEAIFTCSFSEEVDLLSQWRGYSTGGHGYCLHFDLDELLMSTRTKFKNSNIYPCVYDDLEKIRLINLALSEYWDKFRRVKTDTGRQAMVQEFSKTIGIHASYFKHPSFSEEREHRLVIRASWITGDQIRFRVGSMSVIPYIEVPVSRKLIRVVGIGPTRNQGLARRGLVALIESNYDNFQFLTDVDIRESLIPYRS